MGKHLHHLWPCHPHSPTRVPPMCWSDCSWITPRTCMWTHTVHICMSESISLGCRVANRMLSSVLPAGRHALSITAKYRRLLSEGLEDLGCPNQSPDLNPRSAIKLKQFRVMKAPELFSCCVTRLLMLIWVAREVRCSEPKCCQSQRIGVCRWMIVKQRQLCVLMLTLELCAFGSGSRWRF